GPVRTARAVRASCRGPRPRRVPRGSGWSWCSRPGRCEHRQVTTVGHRLPTQLHLHPDVDLHRVDVDHVGEQPYTFVEVDERHRVRHPIGHPRMSRPVHDAHGVDLATARRGPPLDVRAQAPRAPRPRVPERLLAGRAPRQHQRAPFGGRPERHRLVGDRRLVAARCRRAHVDDPSTQVDIADSTPPEPLATAILQPGTCRGPASPRSWRTASTIRNIPYMPGCVYDSPPPLVLVGSSPPGPSLPSSTNGPPSPFLQNPRSSSSSSVVIVNES